MHNTLFIGFGLKITIQTKNGKAQIRNEETGETTSERTSDPLQTLQRLLKDQTVSNSEFRFVGGAVGYISYDSVRYWEKLPQKSVDELGFPDLETVLVAIEPAQPSLLEQPVTVEEKVPGLPAVTLTV